MNTDRDLLFAVLALQSDLLNADQFVEACTAWSAQKNGSMNSLLLEWGYLSPTDAKNLDYLVVRRLAKHAGNVGASLAGISDERWRWALASLNDPYIQQVLTSARSQSGSRAGPTPAEQIQLSQSGPQPGFDPLRPRTEYPRWLTYAMATMVVLVLALVASASYLLIRERNRAEEGQEAVEAAVRRAGVDRERVDALALERDSFRKESTLHSRRADAAEKQLDQAKTDAAKYKELARKVMMDMLGPLDAPGVPEAEPKELKRKLQALMAQLGMDPGPVTSETPTGVGTNTPPNAGDHEALETKKRAVDTLDKLSKQDPANLDHQRDLAQAYRQLSAEHLKLGQSGPAEEPGRQALALCEKLVRDQGNVPTHRAALAGCHRQLGAVYQQVGKYKEAEESLRAALAILDKLVADEPRVVAYRSAHARSYQELSLIFLFTGRLAEAEASIRKALSMQEEVVLSASKVAEYWSDLGLDYQLLGQLLARANRLIEAEAAHQRALELREKLARENADNPEFRAALASSHQQLATVYHATVRLAQAEAACQKAIASREKLSRDFPAVGSYRRDLAVSQRTLGAIHLTAGRLPQAEAACQKALEILSELLKQSEKHALYQRDQAGTFYELASVAAVQSRSGAKEDRDKAAARALALLAKAQAGGFFQSPADRTRLESDANFDSLKSREEFKRFLEGLAKP